VTIFATSSFQQMPWLVGIGSPPKSPDDFVPETPQSRPERPASRSRKVIETSPECDPKSSDERTKHGHKTSTQFATEDVVRKFGDLRTSSPERSDKETSIHKVKFV
jgi:hypothetical protein